jgi:hypothetical protein
MLGTWVLFAFVLWGSLACNPVTCQIIDTADSLCHAVTYTAPDGTKHTVQVTSQELQGFAMVAERAHAEEKLKLDGGAPVDGGKYGVLKP